MHELRGRVELRCGCVAEKIVDVLLGSDISPPWCSACRAVAERAERQRRALAARIQQHVSARGSSDLHCGVRCNTPVVAGVAHVRPLRIARELDDTQADRGLHVPHDGWPLAHERADGARIARFYPTRKLERR